MIPFRYALFDFDGTLVDSQWYWQTVLIRMLWERGIPVPEEEVEACLDIGWLDKHDEYRRRFGIQEPLFGHYRDLFPYVDMFYKTEVMWKPSALNYLEYLRANGVTLALFSATKGEMLWHALCHLGVEDYFDYIFSGYDLQISKSDPESFRYCLKTMGATVENTVLFEDALYSIKTAKSLGMTVYAVQERCSRKNREEIRSLADRFAVRLEELIDETVTEP